MLKVIKRNSQIWYHRQVWMTQGRILNFGTWIGLGMNIADEYCYLLSWNFIQVLSKTANWILKVYNLKREILYANKSKAI